MKFSKVIPGLLLATATTALAQPVPPEPPAPPGPPRPMSAPDAIRDGAIQQVLVTPRGDIDGIVLRDGTVIRFPPHAAIGAARLRPGAAVHASGAQVARADGLTLFDARVAIDGALVADAQLPPPPPRPDQSEVLRPLDPMTVTGRVVHVLTNREGVADAVILDDGAIVNVGPAGNLARAGVALGSRVTATGVGGRYPQGRSLEASTLQVDGDAPISIERVPPRPPRP